MSIHSIPMSSLPAFINAMQLEHEHAIDIPLDPYQPAPDDNLEASIKASVPVDRKELISLLRGRSFWQINDDDDEAQRERREMMAIAQQQNLDWMKASTAYVFSDWYNSLAGYGEGNHKPTKYCFQLCLLYSDKNMTQCIGTDYLCPTVNGMPFKNLVMFPPKFSHLKEEFSRRVGDVGVVLSSGDVSSLTLSQFECDGTLYRVHTCLACYSIIQANSNPPGIRSCTRPNCMIQRDWLPMRIALGSTVDLLEKLSSESPSRTLVILGNMNNEWHEDFSFIGDIDSLVTAMKAGMGQGEAGGMKINNIYYHTVYFIEHGKHKGLLEEEVSLGMHDPLNPGSYMQTHRSTGAIPISLLRGSPRLGMGGLVSQRNVKSIAIILDEDEDVMEPKEKQFPMCCYCGKYDGKMVCGRCHSAHYCNRQCQKKHYDSLQGFQCKQMSDSLPSLTKMEVADFLCGCTDCSFEGFYFDNVVNSQYCSEECQMNDYCVRLCKEVVSLGTLYKRKIKKPERYPTNQKYHSYIKRQLSPKMKQMFDLLSDGQHRTLAFLAENLGYYYDSDYGVYYKDFRYVLKRMYYLSYIELVNFYDDPDEHYEQTYVRLSDKAFFHDNKMKMLMADICNRA